MKQSPTIIAKRLLPGQDLRQSITNLCATSDFTGGCVICAVGSLSRVRLRLPLGNGSLIQKTWNGPCEIVSLTGTISERGMAVHLHLSFANSAGQVYGGHVLEGCIVHTTVELIISAPPSLRFTRRKDGKTGFEELCIEKL